MKPTATPAAGIGCCHGVCDDIGGRGHPSAYNPYVAHLLHADRYRRSNATGLFFIAFSLRLEDLQLSLVIRTQARYLLFGLIVITCGSGFVLMPGQSLTALAAEILSVSVAYAVYTPWSLIRAARQETLLISADLVGRWIGMAAVLPLEHSRAAERRDLYPAVGAFASARERPASLPSDVGAQAGPGAVGGGTVMAC